MLDKMPGVCYTIIRKGKEIKKMKREQYYKNKRTGERTESHKQAMEWYRGKDEIEVWYFSETLGEWLCGIEWTW
jgi:hypothetical protein